MIKLTNTDDSFVLVNPSRITYVESCTDTCVVRFDEGRSIRVRESIDKIQELIRQKEQGRDY